MIEVLLSLLEEKSDPDTVRKPPTGANKLGRNRISTPAQPNTIGFASKRLLEVYS